MWHFLTKILLLSLVTGGDLATQVTYRRLLEGKGVTIVGTHETYFINWSRCAAVCGIRSTCITWTHDSATNTCKVFTQVSPVGFLPSAPSSVGVFADLDDGFFLLNTASGTGSTWLEGQAQCAANNGVIAYAGYEQIKLLLQSVQHSMVWMGLTYDSGAGVWRDHLGNVPQNLYWKSGEPDGVNVYSYYSVWGEGLVAIWGTIWDGKATLCAYV